MKPFDPLFLVTVIAGMVAVTFPIRFLPLAVFNRIELPKPIRRYLQFVPTAIFSAILIQIVAPTDRQWSIHDHLPLSAAAIVAAIIGAKTKSMLWPTFIAFGLFYAMHLLIQ